MEPMDPNDSPLSNLDLWCDWSGIPEDPVSITIAMEAYGHPNLNLPILNVQSPNTVKRPYWVIRLKHDFAHYDADTPPEKESCRPGQEYGDETKGYPANNGSISASGSVIVHDGSRDDDPQGISRRTVDISGMYTQVDSSGSSTSSNTRKSQVNSVGSPISPNPRKRSAKAASLPDSIPPDDECHGARHKLMMTKIDPPPGLEPVSQNTTSTATENIASSIPISRLSASLDEASLMPENIPLPQDSPPTLTPNFSGVTFENPSPNIKGTTVDNVPDETTPWSDAETRPSNIDLSGTKPLTEANLLQRSYDTLSTRACNGSLSDTEDSGKEKEDLLLSLESIGSPSFFSGRVFDGHSLPQTSVEIAKKHKPKLVLDNDILYLQTLPTVCSATYQIAIFLKVRLQKGKSREWWELVVSGLPRLAQSESGYLYFRTPPGQGMEFTTSSFKRHTLVESCLMAQFDGGKSLVVPFRKCNAECYGQLKDHKVNTVIRAEVAEAGDPSSYLIKYNSVCSIDLINHNFWAEKCKFYLFVHGGPDGEFDAVFAAKKPLVNSIRLQPAPDGIGISRINITSIPQALDMFTLSWDVELPRGKAVTWMPWIKSKFSYSDAETILQEDYAIFGPKHEVIPPKHQKVDTRCPFPCCQLGALHFKPSIQKIPPPYLHGGFAIHEPGIFNPFSKNPTLNSTSTQTSANTQNSTSTQTLIGETPAPYLQRELYGSLFGKRPAFASTQTQTLVVETTAPRSAVAGSPAVEPKKPRRAVRGLLWALIKLLFQLLVFAASAHTIYWSYLLHNCPPSEVYVYVPDDHAGNFTNADAEKVAETVPAEFDLYPGLILPEVQQSINTTPADITPVPLRDRIDYFLGWRGPIARE
ncbi:unnamed protein product [Penicillium glandicola]